MGRGPNKVHYWVKGDRYTKCGRDPDVLDIPTTDDMGKVTCGHCRTPNKPFTFSSRR